MNWQDKLESLLTISAKDLKNARYELTDRYRNSNSKNMRSLAEKESYLVSRMPATYEAIKFVLNKINFDYQSVLDIGAGPGTASLAFPELKITAIEKDQDLIRLGKSLSPQTSWIMGDMIVTPFPKADMALFSYSLNEIAADKRGALIKKGWEAAEKALVIIEPGSKIGYQNCLDARALLTDAHTLAPCPHNQPCPLKNDWCHFSIRVPRTKLHRYLKEGSLGYEDEKFSFVILTKEKHLSQPIIIKPPEKHSGHFKLTLCTPFGIEQKTFSKKDDNYKALKKCDWGDPVNLK